jgi:hypothetical protein
MDSAPFTHGELAYLATQRLGRLAILARIISWNIDPDQHGMHGRDVAQHPRVA